MLNNPVIEYPVALLPKQCREIDIMQLIADVESRAIEHQGAAAYSEKSVHAFSTGAHSNQ
jgi:hypothetical protein